MKRRRSGSGRPAKQLKDFSVFVTDRFWRYLKFRSTHTVHACCPDAYHQHMTRHRCMTVYARRGQCWGCDSRDVSRTRRYDLRDDKVQDVANKCGKTRLDDNSKFQVVTVHGLCTACVGKVFHDLSLRNDPAEYFPLLPPSMPKDLKHIIREYVQPDKQQPSSACYYCELDGGAS